MKRFLLSSLVLTCVVMLFVACSTECADGKCDQKRAAKVLEEIHNPQSKNVIVIAHRGDWRNYPENSIPAIEAVIDMNVDIVELDIALTADSVLVLSHDRTLDRCTTGKGRVSDFTYDSLQHFYLKTAHGVRSSLDLKIPTLREALEVCRDRIIVNIDKGYNYYDLVLALTEELGVTDQVLIKGGRPLAEVEKVFAAHKNNMMYMPIITPTNASHRKMFAEFVAAEKPQLAYEICWSKMTPEVEQCMKQVVASGSKLWVNTLWNSLCGGLSDDIAYETSAEEIYGKIVDMGATMIQTDRPEMLIEYLRSRGLHD